MISNLKKYNLPFLISLTAIFILAVFSIITFKQRMFFVDPSWVVFNIINKKEFVFSEHRYGAFITQMFPLIATHLGLSVKSILILYSFSFYLFYASAAAIIGFIFKQKWLVILQAFYLTLFVSDVYYWPNNEVHQGFTWMLLFLGLYLYQKEKPSIFFNILMFSFLSLAISSHLLVGIPLIFLWIYIHADINIKTLLKDKKVLIYSSSIIVFFIVRYLTSKNGSYDSVKLENVTTISILSILKSFYSGQAKSFIKLVFLNYWLIIPIASFGCYKLIQTKDYFKLLLLTATSLGYFSLICITFPNSFERNLRFYMESEWLALSIILATPFVFWIVKNKHSKMAILSIFLIFSIRLGFIFNSFNYFDERFQNLSNTLSYLETNEIPKALLIENKKIAEENFIMSWGLPVESILLSKMNGNKIQSTIKLVNENSLPPITKNDFYSSFYVESMQNLNSDYFILDTIQNYQEITNLKID